MKALHEIFRTLVYAFLHTAVVLIKTKLLWSWRVWTKFWFVNEPEKKISICKYKFVVRGSPLFAKLTDMYVILENINGKVYNPSVNFAEDSLVVDIGAHIGGFAVLAGDYAKYGTIYAFEPFPDNFKLLKENIELNTLSNILAFNVAVSSSVGTADFYIDSLNTSAHSLTKKSSRVIKVLQTTLKNLLETNNIKHCNFLKIDCEGCEYGVILGTPIDILKNIDKIVLEYHVPEYFGLSNNGLFRDLIDKLSEAGFRVSAEPENYQRGYIFASRV